MNKIGRMRDCIFCKIVNKKAPAKILHETPNLLVFPDIRPAADTHILIVPKKHISTFLEIKKQNKDLIFEMLQVARNLIQEKKLNKKYRVSFNGGSLQIVPHLHMPLLGGNMKKIV